MTVIKTNLRTDFTDENGNIDLHSNYTRKAFGGVFDLGLIMGCNDRKTGKTSVDKTELKAVNEQFDTVIFNCLYGMAGIGALMRNTKSVDCLTVDEQAGIGLVIQELCLLAMEAQNHQQSIVIKMSKTA